MSLVSRHLPVPSSPVSASPMEQEVAQRGSWPPRARECSVPIPVLGNSGHAPPRSGGETAALGVGTLPTHVGGEGREGLQGVMGVSLVLTAADFTEVTGRCRRHVLHREEEDRAQVSTRVPAQACMHEHVCVCALMHTHAHGCSGERGDERGSLGGEEKPNGTGLLQ